MDSFKYVVCIIRISVFHIGDYCVVFLSLVANFSPLTLTESYYEDPLCTLLLFKFDFMYIFMFLYNTCVWLAGGEIYTCAQRRWKMTMMIQKKDPDIYFVNSMSNTLVEKWSLNLNICKRGFC